MNPKPAALPAPGRSRTARPGSRSPAATAEANAPVLDDMLSRRSALLLELGNVEAAIARVATESICGSADESQDVELYDGTLGVPREFVANHESSVGHLRWLDDLAQRFAGSGESPGNVAGLGWGTGALIEPDLFLTAGHSFDGEGNGWRRPSRNGRPVPASELATSMRVVFNYQVDRETGEVREGESFPVVELVEYRLSGLDYAIIRLGANPAGQRPGDRYGKLSVAAKDVEQPRSTLCVIQHPDGGPKRVEAGPMFRNVAGRIEYKDLDTLGGASGAPVLSLQGEIVGVHTNGGCSAFSGANYGTAIGIIRQASEVLRLRRRRRVRS